MARKIAVIGAGLAGLYAAWSAASHGADVELYEKGIIGSKHNCGELFTEIYTSAPEECKLNRIKTFKVIIGDKITNIDFGETSPFVMTDKCQHELIMKKKCEELGVIIKEKAKVYCHVKDKDRKEIDATGTSLYELSMGKAVVYVVKNMRANSYYKGIDLSDDSVAVFDIRDDLMGYSWFFPKGKDLCNMGEGVYYYKYDAKFIKPEKSDIIFSGGGLLPMPTMNEFYYNITNNRGKIKVGNAAGLVNSCLGGGEHLAVISGILAGELVAKGIESRYYEALLEIIGDEMRFGISGYELLRKLDINSVSKLIETKLTEQIDYINLNSKLRETMRKWVNIPEIAADDMMKFVEE